MPLNFECQLEKHWVLKWTHSVLELLWKTLQYQTFFIENTKQNFRSFSSNLSHFTLLKYILQKNTIILKKCRKDALGANFIKRGAQFLPNKISCKKCCHFCEGVFSQKLHFDTVTMELFQFKALFSYSSCTYEIGENFGFNRVECALDWVLWKYAW